jgi:hypothetical protein
MNSRFKFPRRVRIHGGECGAVARALHHEAKIQSLPAVKGNVFFTTNERKQMSTKTIFKRIALVVVSTLGLSLMASVPAANAAYNSTPSTTNITVSAVGRVGYGIEILAYSQAGGANACTDACYLHTRLTDAPAGAGLPGTAAAWATGVALVTESVTVTQFTDAGWAVRFIDHNSTKADTIVAGTYSFAWWVDTKSEETDVPSDLHIGGTAGVKAGTVSVTLGGAPSQITLAASSGTSDSSAVTTTLVEATFKDASGVATLLNSSVETYGITTGRAIPSSFGVEIIGDTNTLAGSTSADSRTSTAIFVPGYLKNPNINGGVTLSSTGASAGEGTAGVDRERTPTHSSVVTFWVGSSKGSGTSTFKVSGLKNLAGVDSGNFTLTLSNPAVIDHACPTTTLTFGRADTSSATLGLRTTSYSKTMPCANQANAAVSPTATELYASTVTGKTVQFGVDVSSSTGGTVTGSIAAITGYVVPTGVATGAFTYLSDSEFSSVSFAATAPSDGQAYSVTFNMSNGKSYQYGIYYKAPSVGAATGQGSVSTNLSSGAKAAVGSTNNVIFTVKDGFGSLVSGATVKVTHDRISTGGASALEALTTDASGQATYAWTDAKTIAASGATTLNTAGTVTYYVNTANASGVLEGSGTLNFTSSAFVTPGSVTITETAEDDDAIGNVVDAVINETITVTTDTGAVMSGVAYSVTLSDGLYERKTYAGGGSQLTGFTDSSGQAFVRIAGFKSGVQTITFTVGSTTKSDTFTVVSSSAKFRAVSANAATLAINTDNTDFVTVTAKDVYGNVVPSMALTVTYTGSNGRIVAYNGTQGGSATTDAKGNLVIGIYAERAGTGTLKVESSAGVAVTTTTTTQGVAPIARVSDVSVVVTSTGISAAVAAADAATDAAAEAIDAANAATDAANLAAEAADAATVAAEEARDAANAATAAVEELATQVATLMAALKAQITTLANTVAKIAKKVKA